MTRRIFPRLLPLVGRQLHPDEVALVVVADRALGGGLLALEDMTTVETDPSGLHVADKELPLPQELGKPLEAVGDRKSVV